MRRPSEKRPTSLRLLLLGCVLVAPLARGASDTPLQATSDGARQSTTSAALMTPPTEEPPLSSGAWVAHGAFALAPIGLAWSATRVGGDPRVGAISAEALSGTVVGSFPARLLFLRPEAPVSGRWAELEVASFGAGVLLTPPIAALGTWALGEVAFGRSQHQGRAYVGALGGAAAGMLLGIVVHEALAKLAAPSSKLKTVRGLIAFGLIGSGATVGYQWAGGGPRHQGTSR